MSSYVKLSTLEFPRYEGDIRLEYPEILESQTGDTFPCPENYALVQWTDPPSYNTETQFVDLVTPINNNGVWYMVWAVRALTQEELDYKNPKTQSTDMSQQGSAPNVIG